MTTVTGFKYQLHVKKYTGGHTPMMINRYVITHVYIHLVLTNPSQTSQGGIFPHGVGSNSVTGYPSQPVTNPSQGRGNIPCLGGWIPQKRGGHGVRWASWWGRWMISRFIGSNFIISLRWRWVALVGGVGAVGAAFSGGYAWARGGRRWACPPWP